ncbi:MAG: DNA repair protein RecN [Verrucomicrobiota bacterium]|nr:DNA repair protein RecN [Verrucomicrobiota bacterium]
MLQYLRIQNLALLEATALEFTTGFIAITGETGAGKSVLLGALSLLSGSRADKTLIRQGCESCVIEAGLLFADTTHIDALLESLALPACEDGALLLRRTLSRSKLPQITVNGTLTTLANLQILGEHWIDFHGPGEPQKLFKEKSQLTLLDSFARIDKPLAQFREGYGQWRSLLKQADDLRSQDRLDADELEFIKRQVEAIDRATLSEESVEALERDYHRLSKSQELVALSSRLENGLTGDDGIADKLGPLLANARDLAGIDDSAAELARRLEALVIEANDLAGEYAEVARRSDFDEDSIAKLNDRMNQWMEIKRKYGPSIHQVMAKREALANKLAIQGDVEGTLQRLEEEASVFKAQLVKQAATLRHKRAAAATDLSKKTGQIINSLGFKKARLSIEIVPEEDLREHGDCSCRFLFAANAGQELLPLNKIASSGEIARVMLALKAVLAAVDETPVLVFDEADANVGGEIARVVGQELAGLGKRHQVFCVTHLPQVAGLAASHFLVSKEQTTDTTTVAIAPLHQDKSARLEELARMLGDRTSKSALSHAEELLLNG